MESRKCLQGPSFSPPGKGLRFDPFRMILAMKTRVRLIPKMIGQLFAAICLFAGTAVPPAEGQILSPRLQTLLELLPYEEEIPVLLYIPDLPLGSLKAVVSKGQNRSRVREALKAHAEQTQPLVRTILHRKGAKRIQSFYLLNRVAAFVKAGEVPDLARIPGVFLVAGDETVLPPPRAQGAEPPEAWNLQAIRAPHLWALGYTGEGVVVATLDSGVDLNHPDLRSKWRGGQNSWFDPHGEHEAPADVDGHGTATMSLIVGGNAGGMAIGVAPGARWIAVKIFNDAGNARISDVLAGFQWLLDPDGNPASDDAPHLVGNAWGFEAADECLREPPYDSIRQAISNLRAAGIATVFSAGNNGPAGGSISPANYPESFAVGSVDANLQISPFSSRGPGVCDGRIYPELVSPGEGIKAADLTFGGKTPNPYSYWSGTSFSVPPVVGAMALLLQAFPGLPLDEMELALKQSARDLGDFGPDQIYGYGLLDLQAAHGLLSRPAPKIAGSPGTFEFGQIENRTLSEGRSFFILNKGLLDLQIQSITLQGPNPEDFPMGENTCRDRILPPGEMCRVGVTFAPLTPGAKAAVLQILSNDPEVPALGIWLSGSGVPPRTKIGFFRAGFWFLDSNGNAAPDSCGIDRCVPSFGGIPGDIPLAGDWLGSGSFQPGIYRLGSWYLDRNGNGAWDGCEGGPDGDLCFPSFGGYPEDIPVVGDWSGSGTTKIGIYRNGAWYLDRNGNGVWDDCAEDICHPSFGGRSQDIPVAGDWAGNGVFAIGIYRQGQWYLDQNGNGAWDGCQGDACLSSFGGPSPDFPLVGKW